MPSSSVDPAQSPVGPPTGGTGLPWGNSRGIGGADYWTGPGRIAGCRVGTLFRLAPLGQGLAGNWPRRRRDRESGAVAVEFQGIRHGLSRRPRGCRFADSAAREPFRWRSGWGSVRPSPRPPVPPNQLDRRGFFIRACPEPEVISSMSVGAAPPRPRVGSPRQKREPGGPPPSGGMDGREPARGDPMRHPAR